MHTVRQWLEQLGLAQHADVFERNAIDPDVLGELTDEDLENLGVHALGHRKKLLKAIAELNRGKAPAPTDLPIQASRSTRGRESTSTEGERRQLTVLFCDMVGFTALANRVDPEVLQGIIRSYEDACAACIAR